MYLLDELKKEIKSKQEELNELVISERNKSKILISSMELDNIINLYYDFIEA